MIGNDRKFRIVFIDPQKLRRAVLVRLLESWAEANGLEVVPVSPPEDLATGPECAMVVLSVGSDSVLNKNPQLWIRSVRTTLPEVPLVILSDREECGEIRAAFKEGARGFIATSLDPALALEALTFLYRGGSFFPSSVLLEDSRAAGDEPSRPAIGEPGAAVERADRASVRSNVRIVASLPQGMSGNGADWIGRARLTLTPRQREVLERLAEGKPNKAIARDLDMTEATVKVHVRQIMRKLGAANRTEAVLRAMRSLAASPK